MMLVGSGDAGDKAADREGRLRSLWRWLPLLLGVLMFDLTADPILGVAVACLKAGWEDFRTAIWLRRFDPELSRGRACARFHLSWGFGKAAATGFAVFAGLVIPFSHRFGEKDFIPVRQAEGAKVVVGVSALLFLIFAYAGIVASLRGKARVWISTENHRARDAGVWPPRSPMAYPGQTNRAWAVLIVASIFSVYLVPIGIFTLAPRLGNGKQMLEVGAVVGFYGSIIVIHRVLKWLQPRVVASSPRDCWTEPADPSW